eukprot:m.54613 g.54613  ORF g.54613 m.54613 type:complete len:476 (+) comp11433_c0_seq3:155-1582(+)
MEADTPQQAKRAKRQSSGSKRRGQRRDKAANVVDASLSARYRLGLECVAKCEPHDAVQEMAMQFGRKKAPLGTLANAGLLPYDVVLQLLEGMDESTDLTDFMGVQVSKLEQDLRPSAIHALGILFQEIAREFMLPKQLPIRPPSPKHLLFQRAGRKAQHLRKELRHRRRRESQRGGVVGVDASGRDDQEQGNNGQAGVDGAVVGDARGNSTDDGLKERHDDGVSANERPPDGRMAGRGSDSDSEVASASRRTRQSKRTPVNNKQQRRRNADWAGSMQSRLDALRPPSPDAHRMLLSSDSDASDVITRVFQTATTTDDVSAGAPVATNYGIKVSDLTHEKQQTFQTTHRTVRSTSAPTTVSATSKPSKSTLASRQSPSPSVRSSPSTTLSQPDRQQRGKKQRASNAQQRFSSSSSSSSPGADADSELVHGLQADGSSRKPATRASSRQDQPSAPKQLSSSSESIDSEAETEASLEV